MNKKYTIKSNEVNKETSEKTILLEIPAVELADFKEHALKHLGEGLELPGFRKGKIPNNVLEEKIGKMGILEEEIDLWVRQNIGEIMQTEGGLAISMPNIVVKKATPDNPVEIEILIPLKPEFTLPDYKKIAEKINKNYTNEIKVEEKEITDSINNIKSYLQNLKNKENPENKKEESADLTDEDVQKISPFKNVAELKENLEKNLLADKKRKQQEKNRAEIIEAILKETKIGIPKVMIENEITQMFREFEQDISRMGLKLDDYLKQIKKTREELISEWQAPAKKRAESELLMRKISEEEKIEPKKDELEKETNHILEHNKELKKEDVEIYVRWILRKEETLKFLENLK